MAKKKKATTSIPIQKQNTPNNKNSSSDITQNIIPNIAVPPLPVVIDPVVTDITPFDLDQALGCTSVANEKEVSTGGAATPVGERVLQLLSEDTDPEEEFWSSSIYGYILGANPPVPVVTGFINRVWRKSGIDKISFANNGVFVVRFQTREQMLKVVQEGYKLFDNKPVVVEPWFPDVELKKSAVVEVPVWMKMHKLPLKYWDAALAKIAGIVGKFMKADYTTEQ
ncbi:hypothetical protein vseg_018162 [Gypsophila vaccaria]